MTPVGVFFLVNFPIQIFKEYFVNSSKLRRILTRYSVGGFKGFPLNKRVLMAKCYACKASGAYAPLSSCPPLAGLVI